MRVARRVTKQYGLLGKAAVSVFMQNATVVRCGPARRQHHDSRAGVGGSGEQPFLGLALLWDGVGSTLMPNGA